MSGALPDVPAAAPGLPAPEDRTGAVASGAGHGPRVVSLGDQVLSGLSNFLTVALVARSASPEDFGHFSLAYAVLLTLLNVTRGLWGTPIALAASPAAALGTARALLGSAVLLAPVMALVVAVPSFLLSGGASWQLLVLIGLAAPVVCAQDVCRFAAVSAERPWVAVASDGVWVGVVLVGYLLRPDVRTAVAIWLAGAVVSLVVAALALRVRPELAAGRRKLRTVHSTGAGVAASNIAMQVGSYVVLALATLVVSASAAGALRGASSVMAPVNTLLGFLALGLLPMVHRRPPAERVRAVARIAGILLVATAAWSAVLLFLPRSWGSLLLGDTWPLSRELLPWTAVEYLFLAVCASALLGLQAGQAGRLLVRAGLGAALLLIGAGVIAALTATEATPFAIGQAAAAGVAAVGSWVLYLSYVRRRSD